MATLILDDAHISIAGNDLSDHANSVTLEYTYDEVEDSNFGDNTHQFMPDSLQNWTLNVTFAQDYASGSVSEILWNNAGKSVALVLRPKSSAVATDNPEYTADGIIINPGALIGGSVGERATAEVTIRPSSTGSPDLSRATA